MVDLWFVCLCFVGNLLKLGSYKEESTISYIRRILKALKQRRVIHAKETVNDHRGVWLWSHPWSDADQIVFQQLEQLMRGMNLVTPMTVTFESFIQNFDSIVF